MLGRDDINPDIRDLKGKTAPNLAVSGGHKKVVESLLAPIPSLPLPVDIDKAPEHPPSPDSSDLFQNPCPSTPPARTSPTKLLLSDTQPVLQMAIRSFMIISSFIFPFHFVAVISLPLLAILLLSFRERLLYYSCGVGTGKTFANLS